MPAATSSPSGGIAAGIRQAKGEWLLLLEPGARLVEGWIDAVVAHTARQTMPARFSRAARSRTPFLSRVFSGNRGAGRRAGHQQAAGHGLSKNARSAEAHRARPGDQEARRRDLGGAADVISLPVQGAAAVTR